MKTIAWLFSFLLLACTGFGQAKIRTQITGSITDAKTGEPVVGASVMLSDSRIGTTTDSAGNYILKNIATGHTIIEVAAIGYKTIVDHIDINANTVQNFILQASIIANEGVTVTAVGSATSIRRAPIPITRVSKTELLATPSTNIIDALSHQPGVSQLSTGPAISKPIIRGLGYNRLIVINDGIRQEGQQWGDEHGIEIDENSVSHVEIVKGPASLIYGSDAIAGVINIVTTSPLPANTLRGTVITDYQTNNKQRSVFANIGGNENGWNWNAWGDYKAAADYINKYDGRVFNSKFNEKNAGGYVGYNGSWGYSHLIVSNFNQRLGIVEGDRDAAGNFIKLLPGGAEGIPSTADFNSTDPQVPYQRVQHFKLISENSFKAGSGRISLNLGWQQNQRQEFGNPDVPGEKTLFFNLQTFNYSIGYHFKDVKGWNTTIGVNGMQQANENKGLEVLIPEYNLFDIGGFVYTQKTAGKTTLSGGVRFDNRSLHSKAFTESGVTKFAAFDKNFSNLSGSIGASYAASEKLTVKANFAQGFRAPSIPELASNGAHEGTNRYEYGSVNLKSEISLQGDLGLEWNAEHIRIDASAFYNHISNFIFYSKLSGAAGADSLVLVDGDYIPAFQFGQHNANLTGVEALVDLHPHPLDWLHWQNTFSYVQGRFSDAIGGSRNVPFVPATRLISELRASFLEKGKKLRALSFGMEVDQTFSQKHPFIAYETETATGAYTLLNAFANASIVRKNKTLFSIYLNATNLGDVAYQSHLSRLKYAAVNLATGRQGVFNTGRNFSIKLNVPLDFK